MLLHRDTKAASRTRSRVFACSASVRKESRSFNSSSIIGSEAFCPLETNTSVVSVFPTTSTTCFICSRRVVEERGFRNGAIALSDSPMAEVVSHSNSGCAGLLPFSEDIIPLTKSLCSTHIHMEIRAIIISFVSDANLSSPASIPTCVLLSANFNLSRSIWVTCDLSFGTARPKESKKSTRKASVSSALLEATTIASWNFARKAKFAIFLGSCIGGAGGVNGSSTLASKESLSTPVLRSALVISALVGDGGADAGRSIFTPFPSSVVWIFNFLSVWF
mmetsp:Transcript_25136/g.38039  ORF Transcript_25136/g.38039 Transcript_25136/m.38039 type:complete len:277 (-) Transcript_25136:2388-3218(-)